MTRAHGGGASDGGRQVGPPAGSDGARRDGAEDHIGEPAERRRDEIAELDRLARFLTEKRLEIDRLNRERDQFRARLASLQRLPAARLALAAATSGRKVVARVRGLDLPGRSAAAARQAPIVGRLMPVRQTEHRLRASARAEADLRAAAVTAAARALPGTPADGGHPAPRFGRVLAVVRSGGDPALLERVVASLDASTIDELDVVVRLRGPADPGPGPDDRRGDRTAAGDTPASGDRDPASPRSGDRTDGAPARQAGLTTRIADRQVRGRPVSVVDDASLAALLRTRTAVDDAVLLIHDDVEPLAPTSIARLVATLAELRDVSGVTGRLILPRRAGPRLGPRSEPADLTIAGDGIAFEPRNGRPRPIPVHRGTAPLFEAAAVRDVPAASAACLLVRGSAAAAAGPDIATDDDIAPALAIRDSGGRMVVDERAAFLHAERSEPARPPEDGPPPWAQRIHRAVLLDRIAGGHAWSTGPVHLAITVTHLDEAAGFGDWYTAHEIGAALERLGWRITYVMRTGDDWYQPREDLDAVLVLLSQFDPTRLPPGIVRIAWVRSWADHWTGQPWFDDYDIVLASSAASKAAIESVSSLRVEVFPLATNPDRFHPGPADADHVTEVAFVGSHFGRDRDIAIALPVIAGRGVRVGVWGKGWSDVPGVGPLEHGQLAYERVPIVYRSTRIVVDDAVEGTTRDLGMMNSRVFDALASGALIVTNNVVGAAELMDAEFPTWTDPQELATVVGDLLADPARMARLVDRYRAKVLADHTYERRAEELRDRLTAWAAAEHWAIAIGPRTRDHARSWGDSYFARALQRQLVRRDRPTTVTVHDEWPATAGHADVVLHLFGARAPRPTPGPVNLLWVISHPERIGPDECAGYDAVLAASDRFAADLAKRTAVPVHSVHQATDPERFRPTPGGVPHELLFIGSSRGQRRPMVDAAAASGRDLAVYGGGWTDDLMDRRHHRGDWIPNEAVAAFYSAAEIVLADHYDDMRDLGFISNRLYDALACAAFVLSDDVAGLEDEFDGGAVGCATRDEAIEMIERFLDDAPARRERAERGRRAVLERHTFGHRADEIIAIVAGLHDARSRSDEAREGGRRG